MRKEPLNTSTYQYVCCGYAKAQALLLVAVLMPMFYVHVPVGNKGTLKQAQLGGAAREPDETDT